MKAGEIVLAHQYLYYIGPHPIWTDYEYDDFCARNNLEGSGGSDLASDYPAKIKKLARAMIKNPSAYPSL